MNLTTLSSRLATGVVAGVAGFASYSHIVKVAKSVNEADQVAFVLPLSIDGLIVVGTMAMLDDRKNGRKPRLSARVALGVGVVATLAANVASAQPSLKARLVAAVPALAFLIAVEVLARTGRIQAAQPVESQRASHPGQVEVPVLVDGLGSKDFDVPLADPWLYSEPFGPEPATVEAAVGPPGVAPEPAETAAQKVRQDERVSHEIDQLVWALRSTDPKMSRRRMAKLVQVSDTTIRRALERLEVVGGDQAESQPVPAVNGHKVLEEVTR